MALRGRAIPFASDVARNPEPDKREGPFVCPPLLLRACNDFVLLSRLQVMLDLELSNLDCLGLARPAAPIGYSFLVCEGMFILRSAHAPEAGQPLPDGSQVLYGVLLPEL